MQKYPETDLEFDDAEMIDLGEVSELTEGTNPGGAELSNANSFD